MQKPLRLILAIAACSLTLSACSSTADTTVGADAEETTETLTPVSIGVLPVLPTAGLQLGIEEGFFEQRGLDVTLQEGQGGAALLPAVVSGEIQFAVSNPVAVMIAQDRGLPVEVIAGFTNTKRQGDDVTGIWAMPDSEIESPADLAGRRVAVNTFNSQGDVMAREAVRQDGGDADEIEFVEVPFPNMQAALERGDVDAVWTPEPFQTLLKEAGAELVSYNFQEVAPGAATMVLIAGNSLTNDDPELVDRFMDAYTEALEYAQANPDAVRAVVRETTELGPLADTVGIEDFDADIDADVFEIQADLTHSDGLIKERVKLDDFLPNR